MPSFKLSEHLIEGFKGKGPNRIKKIMLASNPMRMSFRGKEMVFCRYNYFKKIKRNHLEKFQLCQDKQREQQVQLNPDFEQIDTPDSFKVAKTVLHQGSLLPLAPIV
jgi:hypothetical protein